MLYERLTKKDSSHPCHIKCEALPWILSICDYNITDIDTQWICDSCPFSKYLKKLNKLENFMEDKYDDGK